MMDLRRKDFLKKISLLIIGSAAIPKTIFSRQMISRLPHVDKFADIAATPFIMDSNAIIDMHCHPSLGMYMLNKKFWAWHIPLPGMNLIHMQIDLHQMGFGYVKGMVAAHYLPEASIEKQWDLVKKLFPLLNRFLHGIVKKIENENPTNFVQIKEMIDILESQIARTNKKQKKIEFVIAKNFEEFSGAISRGAIPIAHAIEGAHALGRNFPISSKRRNDMILKNDYSAKMVNASEKDQSAPYIRNLIELKQRGVCLMALAHFFRNDIVSPVEGISPDGKKGLQMAWQYTPDQDRPLTPVGRDVVRKMFEIGMIVDLTHSAPKARKEVFEINKQVNEKRKDKNLAKRPVVFTHSGAQQIFEYYDMGHYPYYKYYDASEEEILAISACDGVIGVIPENFWLVGADTHLKKEFRPAQFRKGIPYMIQTMKYINSLTISKDFTNVCIGTDFDGLADNPEDLFRPKQLIDLIHAMKIDPEIGLEATAKITSGNALRVLEAGWGA